MMLFFNYAGPTGQSDCSLRCAFKPIGLNNSASGKPRFSRPLSCPSPVGQNKNDPNGSFYSLRGRPDSDRRPSP